MTAEHPRLFGQKAEPHRDPNTGAAEHQQTQPPAAPVAEARTENEMRNFTRRQRPDGHPDQAREQGQAAEDVGLAAAVEPEPETAESRAAEAEHASAEAERSRTEAERLLAEAEAEAARIVADARERAQDLKTTASKADYRAEAAAERAGYLAHAQGLRHNVRAAEDLATTLAAEADKLTARVADLDARLAEAAARQEDAAAALATAREAGDFAGVRDGRAELAAVDEVAGVLAGQRQSAVDRLTVIGPADGAGELSGALSAAQTARTDLSGVLDKLDPERIEARKAALMAAYLEQTGGDAQAAALLTVAATDPELVAAAYGSPSPDHQK
jgi:DNA repair exonuclease SbcCD ATPase subunit